MPRSLRNLANGWCHWRDPQIEEGSSAELMRVLHVNEVSNVARTLVDGLHHHGIEASLQPVRAAGAQYPLALKFLFLPARLAEFSRINAQVWRQRYDRVHIHYAYLGWLGILGRYPYDLHCHGTDVRMDLRHPVRRLWVVPSLRQAGKVFFSTPDIGDLVRSVRPDAVFLPNPVRTDLFRPPTHPEPSGERTRILLFSDLNDKIKGTSMAIAALEQLRSRHPEVSIYTFARGPDLAKYRGLSWLQFLQPASYDDMPEILRGVDIVVGRFRLGSLGMSELESMACGKPVICHFSYAHWYTEPPPVLSADSPEEVVRHLSRLVADRGLRISLGQAGRTWVEKHHDHLTITQRLADIYRHDMGSYADHA